MNPLSEHHLAIFRRHMIEVIDVQFDLLSEEIGRPRMGERLRSALPRRFLIVQAPYPTKQMKRRNAGRG